MLIKEARYWGEEGLGVVPEGIFGTITEIDKYNTGRPGYIRVLWDGYPNAGKYNGWGIHTDYISKVYKDPIDEIMAKIGYPEK